MKTIIGGSIIGAEIGLLGAKLLGVWSIITLGIFAFAWYMIVKDNHRV